MKQMNEREQHIYEEIDNILWNDWDPIGVNDIAPRDEYQSYTPIIFSMKMNGASKEVIAKSLDGIATQRMGLSSNFQHCQQVAEKIIKL